MLRDDRWHFDGDSEVGYRHHVVCAKIVEGGQRGKRVAVHADGHVDAADLKGVPCKPAVSHAPRSRRGGGGRGHSG